MPEEIREDRDDLGHFLVYDDQPWLHVFSEAGPRWEYDHLRVGPPRGTSGKRVLI
ncbi:hypothetical protein ACIBI9_00680 [Nonomuraea sp. NPDC050451]|uniref:hypothetical protein n=1 Tax=Nonomuraea sp. NPDC050451 TaxID=3364364 RepID=UPI0037BB435E